MEKTICLSCDVAIAFDIRWITKVRDRHGGRPPSILRARQAGADPFRKDHRPQLNRTPLAKLRLLRRVVRMYLMERRVAAEQLAKLALLIRRDAQPPAMIGDAMVLGAGCVDVAIVLRMRHDFILLTSKLPPRIVISVLTKIQQRFMSEITPDIGDHPPAPCRGAPTSLSFGAPALKRDPRGRHPVAVVIGSLRA